MIPMNDNIDPEKQLEEWQLKLKEFANLRKRLWKTQNLLREELDKLRSAFYKG